MNSAIAPDLKLGDTNVTESGADAIPMESTATLQASYKP